MVIKFHKLAIILFFIFIFFLCACACEGRSNLSCHSILFFESYHFAEYFFFFFEQIILLTLTFQCRKFISNYIKQILFSNIILIPNIWGQLYIFNKLVTMSYMHFFSCHYISSEIILFVIIS